MPYYAGIHWLQAAGLNLVGWRIVSLSATLAATLLLYSVFRSRGVPLSGAVAAVAFVSSPVVQHNAVTARPYALATAGCTAATWGLTRVRGARGPGLVAWVGVPAAFSVWMHPFSAALLLPHVFWSALTDRRVVKRVVAAWAVALLVEVPIVGSALRQADQAGWIPPATVGSMVSAVQEASGRPAPLVAMVAIAGVMAALGWKGPAPRNRAVMAALGVAIWCSAVGLVVGVSVFGRPAGIPRYLVAVPLGVALALGGIAAVGEARWGFGTRRAPQRWSWASAGVIALLCVFSAMSGGPHLPSQTSYEGHPDIDKELLRRVSVGDIVVFHQGMSETGYAYGFARAWQDDAFLSDYRELLRSGQPALIIRVVIAVDSTSLGIRTAGPDSLPIGSTRTVWLIQLYGDNRIAELASAGLADCSPRESTDAIHVIDTHVRKLTCAVAPVH